MSKKELLKWLINHAKDTEWMMHHAAEDQYCPYCVSEEKLWGNQVIHKDDCEYMKYMAEAEKLLLTLECEND